MDKMQLFCTQIRAALACYEDMPPEGQARGAAFCDPQGRGTSGDSRPQQTHPVGSLPLNCCKNCNNLATTDNNAHILRGFSAKRAYLVKSQRKFQRFIANAKFFAHFCAIKRA